MRQRPAPVRPRRIHARTGVVLLMAVGAFAAAAASNSRFGWAAADPAPVSAFVAIQDVAPNVRQPPVADGGSSGTFQVDCGTNGNRKLSADNPVAQPGVKMGAQHVHDFVGNLSINADSSDASLEESGTTCRNGDKSSYFWPVVRINRQAGSVGATAQTLKAAGTPSISCPTVADRLPAVPTQARAEVNRNLDLLSRQVAEADQRLVATQGQGGPDFVNNAILGPLRSKRVATLDRISIAIGRTAPRPANLLALVDCDLSYHGAHAASGHTAGHSSVPATQPEATTAAGLVATPTINCPTVRDKLPAVPQSALADVNRNLDLLDSQIAEANQRLVTTQGQGGPNFVNNAILGPLRSKRVATLDRIAIAIGRTAQRPTGLEAHATCGLNNAGSSTGAQNGGAAEELPVAVGPDLELAGNVGGIVRPAAVKIEYRGNAVSEVVAMPKFLKAITGDAKPTSRGPANARPSWTCSGFDDRLSSTYVICPAGSQVMRVHDFPGCWDGKNTDSANHRSHLAFADATTGACPAEFQAIPQLRISLSYKLSVDVQRNGQYQLDSFPEENHNPFSDHDDFANVNSEQTMNRITSCINTGRSCR